MKKVILFLFGLFFSPLYLKYFSFKRNRNFEKQVADNKHVYDKILKSIDDIM